MIVAVVAVRVVQAAINEVVVVVAVRHRWMPAIHMATAGAFDWRATIGIGRRDADRVLVVVAVVRVMQVAVVQKIDVPFVLDLRVATTFVVDVVVLAVNVMFHRGPPSKRMML
jgi:hypothetical protein